MYKIYKKINNHEFLDQDDIMYCIESQINMLNLQDNIKKIVFFRDNSLKEYMNYDPKRKGIYINERYKEIDLEFYLKSVKAYDLKCSADSWRDYSNLVLLCSIYHEVFHGVQFKERNENILYKASLEMARRLPESCYLKFWGSFFTEYTANTFSINKIFKDIKNLEHADPFALYFLNSFFSDLILQGNGIYKDNQGAIQRYPFHSPLEYIDRYKDSIRSMSKSQLLMLRNAIKKIQETKDSNTYLENLMIGNSLSEDVIKFLLYVSLGRERVTNIFDNIDLIDKQKNKCIKK